MNRHHAAALLMTATAALAGCGSDADAGAQSPAVQSLTPAPAPAPTATPSPNVDPNALLPMGKSTTTNGGLATATVYGYRHNVARSAPRPEGQPGYVWSAADVKVCGGRSDEFPNGIIVTTNPWTLVYADDTTAEASSTGYEEFPEPGFPFGEKALSPGRCVRGWITFPVPGKKWPVAVEYAPERQLVAPRWAVK